MDYVYETIPEGHIRLLKPARPYRRTESDLFHRSDYGTTSHPKLSFEMVTCPIENAPPYTAVSYVWGLGAASQTIYLKGGKFAIRQNLWHCLNSLLSLRRSSDLSDGRLTHLEYLWVDAICINQSDVKEKNEQVRAMNGVYSNAVEVAAWLGAHPSPLYLQWHEEVSSPVQVSDWNLYDIADRPYWSRMWIVQELILAKTIRILIGNFSIEFDYLAFRAKNDDGVNKEDLKPLIAFAETREPPCLGPFRSFVDLLFEFGKCQCQDPRDKVFALLSLLNDDDKMVLDRFFPDYTLTHDAVVVITLTFLKMFYQPTYAEKSEEIMDILGVSSSRLARRRLIAAADKTELERLLEGNGDFLELPFIDPEGLSMLSSESWTLTERPKGSSSIIKTTAWLFAIGFALSFAATYLY